MEYRWVDWVLVGIVVLIGYAAMWDSVMAAFRRVFGWRGGGDPAHEQTALLKGIHNLLLKQEQRAGQAGALADEWRAAVCEQTAMSHTMSDSLSQIRRCAEEITSSTTARMLCGENSLACLNKLLGVAVSGAIDPQQWLSSTTAQSTVLGKILEQLEKNGQQLEKNDQRLADFVGATRRIMRAMEGNSETDEDTQLFEEAKLIQDRAASKGVILTPEDALKRAREQRSYSMGSR